MAASGANQTRVKAVRTDNSFQTELKLAKDKLIVVDFFATW